MSPERSAKAQIQSEVLAGLHRQALEIGKLVGPPGRVVLFDYPNYPNGGDHLIWLGERLILTAAGHELVGEYHLGQAALGQLRGQVGEGTVVLQGGGNFGDLYPWHQQLRMRIFREWTDAPVLMMPQTLHYESTSARSADARVVEKHPRLVLLWRDRESLEVAKAAFPSADSRLAPDAAFALQPALVEGAPCSGRVVCFLRDDRERGISDVISSVRHSVVVEDWPSLLRRIQCPGTGAAKLGWHGMRALTRRLLPPHRYHGICSRETHSFLRFAKEAAGLLFSLFSSASVVVTDRLHGHIAATLLRVPHVFLPNSYGKNKRFFETWTRLDPNVRFVMSREDVPAAVDELLAQRELHQPPEGPAWPSAQAH